MAASIGGMDLKALSQMDPKLLQAVGIDPKMFDPKALADHQHAPPMPLHQPAKVLQTVPHHSPHFQLVPHHLIYLYQHHHSLILLIQKLLGLNSKMLQGVGCKSA